jgi:NADH:ubiquinone oxidoreductase subunit K
VTLTAAVWLVTGLLFVLGLAACVLRRQLLAMLLGLELMIAAVNVAIIIAVAAAEAVVGLSLILRIHRLGGGLDSGALTELRG